MEHPFERKVEQIKISKTEINKLIMDYFITAGYPTAARQFAQEANIQPHTDFESINERVEIRDSIHKGDLQTAIEKINELNPELLDTNASLHFSLLRLQLIELIREASRTGSPTDIQTALEFATINLAPCAPTDPKFLNDLERTMALLIFPREAWENTSMHQRTTTATATSNQGNNPFGPLSELVDPALRRKVAEDVNQAILQSQGERRDAKILHLVRTRAWAEKLARDKKIDLPERLDVGLDGDKPRIGQNGHANGADTVMAENGHGGGLGDAS